MSERVREVACEPSAVQPDALRRCPQRFDCPPEAVFEADVRLPAEHLAGPCDVRLAHPRVVDREGLKDDLARGPRHAQDCLGQLEQRHLVRIAEVHRQMLAARGEHLEAADRVLDIAEAAGLGAVAEDGERLALEGLPQEGRDGAAVVRAHARPVRVEDPGDAGVEALLALICHRQRLGVALRLVVDPARADRVHVAPVGLGLGMDLRVAVHLARRGEQEAGPLELRQAEHVMRPVRADLERVQR